MKMPETEQRMPRELLARRCEQLMKGAQNLYDSGPTKGDMWFFELYHHLEACSVELRANQQRGSET